MNIRRWALAAAALFLLTTAAAAAAGPNDRLAHQERRIWHGAVSGRLTEGELRRLERDQERIERLNRAFRRDGRLSRVERRSLDRHLDRSSEQIYRFKHNARNRFSYDDWPGRRPWDHGGRGCGGRGWRR